ncbi:MAG: hypothetical protein OEO77_13345, partial [Acidimicrobiia bacterium]|nr:hypothetical protein [Acidimicrobiia bacterium]
MDSREFCQGWGVHLFEASTHISDRSNPWTKVEDNTVRSSSKFPWRLVALLAVFAMIVAACGTESTSTTEGAGSTTDTTTPTATTQPATTDTTSAPAPEGFEYKIAVIEDFTTDNVWAWYDTENSVYNQYLLAGSVASVYGQVAPTYTLAPSLALPADP